jgi:uncharacterized cupredoxin-like copper-binding protein
LRRFRLLLVALALTSTAAATLAVTSLGSPSRSSRAASTVKIRVIATEFRYTFGRPSTVKAGTTVIFTVVNKGQVVHDLDFTGLRRKTPNIAPGKSATLKITFKKKGRYAYICSLPRHAEQGMAGTFVVKA